MFQARAYRVRSRDLIVDGLRFPNTGPKEALGEPIKLSEGTEFRHPDTWGLEVEIWAPDPKNKGQLVKVALVDQHGKELAPFSWRYRDVEAMAAILCSLDPGVQYELIGDGTKHTLRKRSK